MEERFHLVFESYTTHASQYPRAGKGAHVRCSQCWPIATVLQPQTEYNRVLLADKNSSSITIPPGRYHRLA